MRIFLLTIVILLGGCQSMPPLPSWQSPEGLQHPDLGLIIDLQQGEPMSARQLVDELADADQVLVGERHDNPDHHALQVWLLQALAQRRHQGSLLLEMLNPDQKQPVELVKTSVSRGHWPADLPAELQWQEGWPWVLYQPLVEYALVQPYPLLPANLDRDEIADIYRRVPALKGRAGGTEVQDRLLEQIRDSHCGMLPEAQLPAMLAVQQQRDRRMAEQLEVAPTPAMLLAGAFHVRRDLGVPLHLANHERDAKTKVLMLAEVGETLQAKQADYVLFTPARPQQDHCAAFGKQRNWR
ncbi:iron(III) ABC transporter [Stutzerimonas zhaodongensis]|uniref:Iron(III) ABC transporter n=1 Tax=Stutzerimonas zhaodongensis TaxID=1176257 RepID=A0A3M2HEA0_9GAMM|nr:ChaN family lipoprotein [Stutzerimonas zhaodongensis]MCQ4318591.1 ChaN family lipoprotein [Stutzerimonas zhaodongensis]RMH88066.1 iron(III) ABC transporter [Stutzerimonas zhaodongensis]